MPHKEDAAGFTWVFVRNNLTQPGYGGPSNPLPTAPPFTRETLYGFAVVAVSAAVCGAPCAVLLLVLLLLVPAVPAAAFHHATPAAARRCHTDS